MNANYIRLFFQLLLFISVAHASTYKIDDVKFIISTPKGWQAAEGFFGSNVKFMGKVQNNLRPVIALDATDLDRKHLDKDKLVDGQIDYRKGRIKWLEKNNGTLVEFYPYSIVNWKHIKNVHAIGYKYTIRKTEYKEINYFFECKNKIFTVSTLITKEQERSQIKEFKGLLDSIQCH